MDNDLLYTAQAFFFQTAFQERVFDFDVRFLGTAIIYTPLIQNRI